MFLPSMPKAFVVHQGIVSSIGMNYAQHIHSLQEGMSGITQSAYLQTKHPFPVGEVKYSNAQLAQYIIDTYPGNYRADFNELPRTALLSILAAKQSIECLGNLNIEKYRKGFISATTVGGMDLTTEYYKAYLNGNSSEHLDKIRYHELGNVSSLTLQALGWECWSTTINTACSSSANSIMMAAQFIENDEMDIVIAGGADALSTFTLNGFNSLMILDKAPCRPFDAQRAGLNLGEGAAYLLLMKESVARDLGFEPSCFINGYGNANDAHHQTASSPEGLGNQLAMQKALNQANLQTGDIGYINLHGTGTENNDASEGAAIDVLFDKNVPLCSSTKAFTGHTLGAAGVIEAVFAKIVLEQNFLPANLRWENQIEHHSFKPLLSNISADINHVMSNSFGFGGNCSSLIISK